MRTQVASLALVVVLAFGCGDDDDDDDAAADDGGVVDGGGECSPCEGARVCRYGVCVPPPATCARNSDCMGDSTCDVTRTECLPWGVGPGGTRDLGCTRDVVPGVFFPKAQCEWLGPPAGDLFPNHRNILGAPMVATFGGTQEFSRPSIVFISYNCEDGSTPSCQGDDAGCTGVIRVVDGRTCRQDASISSPLPIAATSVAIGDLTNDGTPEIVAAKVGGGLVAWRWVGAAGFELLWSSTSTVGSASCNWSGPSIHDLDDDGSPEIILHGAVFDARGNLITSSVSSDGPSAKGYVPVLGDVDRDGQIEMVTGSGVYGWSATGRDWLLESTLPVANSHIAIADFGTFGAVAAGDDRATRDGVAEVVAIRAGTAYVYTLKGREIFTRELAPGGGMQGVGGPPTIADFDGDGRAEFASAGGRAYSVLDLDCRGTPTATTCPTMTTDGLLWARASQDLSSNVTGSSVFDFEGDGLAEAVYGDECFTRVYDGRSGTVVYSRFRTSCTWYEYPIVADVDGDFNAEILVTSNTNCGTMCQNSVDPIFDGVQCLDDSDCPSATRCGRDVATDRLGRCRCAVDADCGGDGFVCLAPELPMPAPTGKVCRAAHPGPSTAFGLRVISDRLDRWVNTRRVWNQHAYSVTNVEEDGRIPRTSSWMRNWDVSGLNNFRQNAPGAGAGAGLSPDLTLRAPGARCLAPELAALSVDVCNRGTEPVGDGLAVAFYGGAAPGAPLACVARTAAVLRPGSCERVSCDSPTGAMTLEFAARADDDGTATGENSECREDNNGAAVPGVSCL